MSWVHITSPVNACVHEYPNMGDFPQKSVQIFSAFSIYEPKNDFYEVGGRIGHGHWISAKAMPYNGDTRRHPSEHVDIKT